jgi:hypothetical protein
VCTIKEGFEVPTLNADVRYQRKRAKLEHEPTDRQAAIKTSQRSGFRLCDGYHERVEPFIMYYLLKTALDDALNPGFKILLLATGDAKLVWQARKGDVKLFPEGIFGLGPYDNGHNLYGIALMRHRDELMQVLEEEARTAASESAPLPQRVRLHQLTTTTTRATSLYQTTTTTRVGCTTRTTTMVTTVLMTATRLQCRLCRQLHMSF